MLGALSKTTPEPQSDIAAQIKAMLTPGHPKDSVFVAAGNESALPQELPPGVIRVTTPQGTLITTNIHKAVQYHTGTDDRGMAHILGYPEDKQSILSSPDPSVIQARDKDGNVVTEAATRDSSPASVGALSQHVPQGGALVRMSPLHAQLRRVLLVRREGR